MARKAKRFILLTKKLQIPMKSILLPTKVSKDGALFVSAPNLARADPANGRFRRPAADGIGGHGGPARPDGFLASRDTPGLAKGFRTVMMAGSFVTRDVPAGVTAFGNPAGVQARGSG